MASDKDLISTEVHELNYLLGEWDKRQTRENRNILVNTINEFKSQESYSPHNRKQFYSYVSKKKIKNLLKGKKTTKGVLKAKTGITLYKSFKDTHDLFNEIQLRAYYLYCDRIKKSVSGDSVGDWLNAEKQLLRKYKMT